MKLRDVAVVGFGGAGTRIVEIISKAEEDVAIYVVNDNIRLEDIIYFDYSELRELVKELSGYNWVILTSGLGGRGGKSLVYIANKLDNLLSVFVIFPSHVEKLRISNAKYQLKSLKSINGVYVTQLENLIRIAPHLRLDLALELIDRMIATKIVYLIKSLK